MEKDTEKPTTNGKELVRDESGKVVSGVLNPNGRPKGSNNFKTDWEAFVLKVAKSNNMTPEEINEQLLAVGFKKAKEGDYSFYRDVFDRVYGKPIQKNEITGEEGAGIQIILKKIDEEGSKPAC